MVGSKKTMNKCNTQPDSWSCELFVILVSLSQLARDLWVRRDFLKAKYRFGVWLSDKIFKLSKVKNLGLKLIQKSKINNYPRKQIPRNSPPKHFFSNFYTTGTKKNLPRILCWWHVNESSLIILIISLFLPGSWAWFPQYSEHSQHL